jgi:hypothetical protein
MRTHTQTLPSPLLGEGQGERGSRAKRDFSAAHIEANHHTPLSRPLSHKGREEQITPTLNLFH